jgi:hypothetical protein
MAWALPLMAAASVLPLTAARPAQLLPLMAAE